MVCQHLDPRLDASLTLVPHVSPVSYSIKLNDIERISVETLVPNTGDQAASSSNPHPERDRQVAITFHAARSPVVRKFSLKRQAFVSVNNTVKAHKVCKPLAHHRLIGDYHVSTFALSVDRMIG